MKRSEESLREEREKTAIDIAQEAFCKWTLGFSEKEEFNFLSALQTLQEKASSAQFQQFLNYNKITIETWNNKIIYAVMKDKTKKNPSVSTEEDKLNASLFHHKNYEQVLKVTAHKAHSQANQLFLGQKQDHEKRILEQLNQMKSHLHPLEFYRLLHRKHLEVVEQDNRVIQFSIAKS